MSDWNGWTAIGIGVFFSLMLSALSKVVNRLDLIADHLRIIRQYELDKLQRQSDAIIDAVHDPLWKRHGS